MTLDAVPSSSAPGETQLESPPPTRRGVQVIARAFLRQREASIVIVAIILMAYFQISNSAFLGISNIQTLAQYTGATAIVATGEVMILILGEIDLSVGNTFALAPFIMYFAMQAGLPWFLGAVVALLVGALIGLVNGVVTVILQVPSFVTTLGMLFLLSGITLTITNGFPVLTPDLGAFNDILGHGDYAEIIWAFIIVGAMQLVLSWTRWGLHTIAVGSNPMGSSETGIDIGRMKIGNFMLAGVFAAFAGMLDAFRIQSIDPLSGGTDIMFSAVAGAVIGGTALAGGSGTVVGALVGVIVLSIIKDGFTLVGINAYTFNAILGLMILAAMILNIRLQHLREAGRS